jgi:hypothetical protein
MNPFTCDRKGKYDPYQGMTEHEKEALKKKLELEEKMKEPCRPMCWDRSWL